MIPIPDQSPVTTAPIGLHHHHHHHHNSYRYESDCHDYEDEDETVTHTQPEPKLTERSRTYLRNWFATHYRLPTYHDKLLQVLPDRSGVGLEDVRVYCGELMAEKRRQADELLNGIDEDSDDQHVHDTPVTDSLQFTRESWRQRMLAILFPVFTPTNFHDLHIFYNAVPDIDPQSDLVLHWARHLQQPVGEVRRWLEVTRTLEKRDGDEYRTSEEPELETEDEELTSPIMDYQYRAYSQPAPSTTSSWPLPPSASCSYSPPCSAPAGSSASASLPTEYVYGLPTPTSDSFSPAAPALVNAPVPFQQSSYGTSPSYSPRYSPVLAASPSSPPAPVPDSPPPPPFHLSASQPLVHPKPKRPNTLLHTMRADPSQLEAVLPPPTDEKVGPTALAAPRLLKLETNTTLRGERYHPYSSPRTKQMLLHRQPPEQPAAALHQLPVQTNPYAATVIPPPLPPPQPLQVMAQRSTQFLTPAQMLVVGPSNLVYSAQTHARGDPNRWSSMQYQYSPPPPPVHVATVKNEPLD